MAYATDASSGTDEPPRLRNILIPGEPRRQDARIYQRDALAPGERIAGPAILEQNDTTTLIGTAWTATVHDNGVVTLDQHEAAS